MSKTDFSFKNIFYKADKEKENENKNIKEKPNYNDINNLNENENNIDKEKFEEKLDEKFDEKIHQNNNKNNDINNNNYSFNESNPNYSISRECLNYYLSYYYEQDFSLDEKDEPQNAGFFARLFGNHPKIYPILPELKSERDFIIFLRRNNLSNENDRFDKIFGAIISFIENNICDIDIEEDKIKKKKNPSNLIKKSNKLLKDKMKSFIEMEIQNNKNKNFFEEYKSNSIPILMSIQLLNIIENYPNFVELFINKCFPNEKEILLAFSFYLSNIAYDRLLSGRLNIFFARNKLVLDDYEDFFLGLFEQSFELFESSKFIDQERFSLIQKEAQNMPSSIFWKAKIFKLKYPSMKTDSSLSKYFNSSSLNQK